MELISIITPTYKNSKEELIRAIKSIKNQTYKNWELLIIDDNIDDNYSDIVKEAVKIIDDKRIIYIKNQQNLGSAKSRNIGISNSKGSYISFLDADDEYLPLKIESQYRLMKNRNADFSITNLNLYNNNDILVRSRNHKYLLTDGDLMKLHLKYHLTGTDTFMFKKKYLIEIGMFDEIDMGDEFYLMMKAIIHNGVLAYLPECNVKAYVHKFGVGLTAGDSKELGENNLYEFKQKYFSFLKSKDIRFIKMRHYLVLFSIQIKKVNILKSIYFLFKAFISSPIKFLKFLLNRREY